MATFSADGTHVITYTAGTDKDIQFDPIQPPQTAPAGADSGVSGVLNGTYTYMCTFVDGNGHETEGIIQSEDVVVTNKKISLTNIPMSTDMRVVARKIYRKPAAYSANVVPLQLLTTINDNTTTTYTDNTADASLGALVNRINGTGGNLYNGLNKIFVADTTSTSIGYDSSYDGTGYACTAVGIHTMPTNAGNRNNAFGMYANYLLTTGSNNNAFGVHGLQNNVTGNDNNAIGYLAGFACTASDNLFIGSSAGTDLTTGDFSVFIGNNAGGDMDVGRYNTFIGYGAGRYVLGTNKNQNTFVGMNSGNFSSDGSTHATYAINCTLLGANTKLKNATADIDSIVIGKDAIGEGTNTVVLGGTQITNTYLRGGINLSKTVTAGGTTGAQTINKPAGTVNFAASATSLVVTNSLVTTSSVIICTVGTVDTTMKTAVAVAGSGSFTITANAAATAETRVNFLVIN